MVRKKLVLFLFLIPSLLLTATSCWDRIEIEDRAIIIGMAMDLAEDEEKIVVTFQIAQPRAYVAESHGSVEGYYNVTKTAEDLAGARNKLSRSINTIPTLEQCQVVLVGDKLAQKGLSNYMDFLLRTNEARRQLQIGVVEGLARHMLEIKFKSDLAPSFVISEMMSQNSTYNFRMTDYMSLEKLHTAFIENNDFILSQIKQTGNGLYMAGGAVIKGFKLAGWLSGEEMIGARFIRGDASSGYLTVDMPSFMGKKIMLRVYETKSDFHPEIRDDKLVAVLNLRLEGDIDEIVNPNGNWTSKKLINQCSTQIEKYVRTIVNDAFHKSRRVYNSEPFRLKEKLKCYYPAYWKANSANWDEIYQAAELETNIEVNIRRVGEIRSP